MKKYIFIMTLFAYGSIVCMDKSYQPTDKSQQSSEKKRIVVDLRLLKIYLDTINTKRNLAAMFLTMPEERTDLSEDQLLFKTNLLKDYKRVNNMQSVILKNIYRTGLDFDVNISEQSSDVQNLSEKLNGKK